MKTDDGRHMSSGRIDGLWQNNT